MLVWVIVGRERGGCRPQLSPPFQLSPSPSLTHGGEHSLNISHTYRYRYCNNSSVVVNPPSFVASLEATHPLKPSSTTYTLTYHTYIHTRG